MYTADTSYLLGWLAGWLAMIYVIGVVCVFMLMNESPSGPAAVVASALCWRSY